MKLPRHWVCHIAGASIGLCLAVSLGLLLDRSDVVGLDASKTFISPSPAESGQTIYITWSAVELRNCQGEVIPRVIDAAGRIYEYTKIPAVYHDLMGPGARYFTKSLILPQHMAPGPARYQAIISRWCNSVQRYVWPMTDKPFPIYFEVK